MKLQIRALPWLLLVAALVASGALSACSSADQAGHHVELAPLAGMPDEVQQAPERVQQAYQFAAANPDVLIPFASIDPAKGKAGAREARRLVADFGIRGFKFHPTMQGFYPNDRSAYVLYEAIAEAGHPALFHTGQTAVGSGQRRGMGMRLKYSNPMYIDDVAVDFPAMKIILAHPSFPWQEEALSVATHKPNVYIDLSGWSPKYFPPILVQYTNSILRHKMLFGSDWPAITPDRWLSDFEKLDIKDEVRPLVLKENARKLLKM